MNPSKLFLTLGVAAALSFRAEAAINVTGAGAGPFDFSTAPASPADFSSLSVPGAAGDIETVAAMDTAVMTNAAAAINTALGTSATVPPSSNAQARRNTTLLLLQTHPTGNTYTILMATMINSAGGTIHGFKLNYDFGMANSPAPELVPGHRVFFSLSGTPGSWQLVPSLSGLTANAPGLSTTFSSITWPAGANAYFIWADDNAVTNLDQANTIDNLSITEVSVTIDPTTITITSPTNNQQVAQSGDLTVTTAATGPITNVAFLLDGVFVTNDTTIPFGGTVTVPDTLPLGPHTLTAVATDSSGAMVTSLPVTFTVVTNAPPMLSITNTFSGTVTGTTFLVGSPITVQAAFSDDDAVTNITWYVDNVIYLTNRVNGTWIYLDSLAGTHVLKGEAADRKGHITTATRTITVTNPPASSYTLLVTNGSEWRYYVPSTTEPPVQGAEPWYGIFFDDTLAEWSSGFAELGNGDAPNGYSEKTMIDIGPANPRFTTMYFRKSFSVADPSLFTTISLRLLRDDGAVVYLNGAPVWTNNIAPTAFPIPYADLAMGSDDGVDYQILNLPNPTGAPLLVAEPELNFVAVEVHQSAVDSTDLSFDLMIWGTAIPNMPPSVTLTNPAPGSNVMVGTFVDVGATAADTDGAVARVDFFDNGVLRFSDAAAPYGFVLSDLTAGAHTISAMAVDNTGSNSTASVMIVVTNPPALTAVLTNGSDWKYLDTGVAQPNTWTSLGFDDSSWSNGIAELGYGDLAGETRPERTVVGFGGDTTNKFVTTYFRKKINVTNPNLFGRLRLDTMRDDGIVVYINGAEVFRNNFTNTTTPIVFSELADAAIGGAAEATYISTNIASSALVSGMNIIAVEIHQEGIDSSDISFDLMLWGTPPELTITHSGANFTVRWNNDPNYRLQQSLNIGSPANWTDIASDPTSPFTTTAPPNSRFFRLRHR